MTQNTANVAAFAPPVAGGVSWAPLGTALPTDADTALDAAFKAFGYISSDGIQYSGDAPSKDDQTAWGGDIVASLETTKKVVRYTIKVLEIFNQTVLEMIFGAGNVTVVAASGTTPTKITVLDKNVSPVPGIWVIEGLYQAKKRRIVLGNADPSVTGEDPFTHSALTGYEVQVTGLPDATGVSRYIYDSLNDAPGA
jgi:hypothetical protein